ncbi:unnamed protein product, partial [marine sediment metagenome]
APQIVYNYTDDMKLVFSEWNDTTATDNLKGYLYGDSGILGLSPIYTHVRYSKSNNLSIYTDGNQAYNDTSTKFNLTGLDADTQYWFRAWSFLPIGGWNSTGSNTVSNTTSPPPVLQLWNVTIRNNGIDYFIWLGSNTTAYNVSQQIDNFNDAGEYFGILGNDTWDVDNGSWMRYNALGGGINFSIKTFDVIQINLNDAPGTQVVNMYENYAWNYTNSKTYTWANGTKNYGFNYTGKMTESLSSLGTVNTSVGLETGEYIGHWNRTTFSWVFYIADLRITDDYLEQFAV